MIILNMYHQPNRSRNSPCGNMLSCRPKGRSAPLACCLPHAGGWKCGQGQATQNAEGPVAEGSLVEGLPVAERAGPLRALQTTGTHARRNAEGANTHGSLQGHADAPLPGRMSPSRCKFEELDKYKFEEVKARPCRKMGGRVSNDFSL